MSSSSWATDEPRDVLWFEQAMNASVYLGGVAYGIHVSVLFVTAYYLLKTKRKNYVLWLVFISLIFGTGTVNLSINMRFNELAFVDNRNYPGGPPAFLKEQMSDAIQTGGNAATLLLTLLSDGLLIYRCYVLYESWWTLIIPVLAWLATFVCGILLTVEVAVSDASVIDTNSVKFGLPYFAISMGLDVVITIILITKLLFMKRRMQNLLGPHYSGPYTTIVVMLLESAVPYSIFSLVFLILYGLQSTVVFLLIPLFVQAQCITPMIIIMRVTRGQAWDNSTVHLSKTSSTFQMKASSTRTPITRSRSSNAKTTTAFELDSETGESQFQVKIKKEREVGEV